MLAGQNLLMFKEIDKFKDTLNLEKEVLSKSLGWRSHSPLLKLRGSSIATWVGGRESP